MYNFCFPTLKLHYSKHFYSLSMNPLNKVCNQYSGLIVHETYVLYIWLCMKQYGRCKLNPPERDSMLSYKQSSQII